jgi:methylmalonyl-CoA/ethylmalonyl-CoA epimerase
MKLHHLGIACKDIPTQIKIIKKTYDIKSVGEIVFDELQNVNLCFITTNNGFNIELVSGKTVETFINNKFFYYHLCFEVNDISFEIDRLIKKGAILISTSKPAILFDNKSVAFLLTSTGLIELLEE